MIPTLALTLTWQTDLSVPYVLGAYLLIFVGALCTRRGE